MTPEELRAAFIRSRGLNLDTSPIPQIPVQSVPIQPTGPAPVVAGAPPGFDPNAAVRMPDNNVGSSGWRAGVNQDIASGVIPNPAANPPVPAVPPSAPYAKPAAFPTEAAPAIPYNPVREPGPAGVSLNSNPVAPGWAGSVGIEPPAMDYKKGFDQATALAGLEDIAKGMKPKAAVDPSASTITPMAVQPNQSNQMAAQLMAAILNRPRGLTLTGR